MYPNHINQQGILDENLNTNPELFKQKCALSLCNKAHCNTPWHKPCTLAKNGLAERLRPMLALIGGLEIIIGIVIIALMIVFGNNYDELYGTNDSRAISLASLNVSTILLLTGCTLVTSLYWNIRRLLLVYIFVSTILGICIFILSVFKIRYGLLMIKEDTDDVRCTKNENFVSSTACLLGLVTFVGSAVHFVGNIVVFTYYNLKYIQPCMFQSNEDT